MNFDPWALAVALLAIAVVFIWTLRTGSPPTPTSAAAKKSMLSLLPRRLPQTLAQTSGAETNINRAGVIYELGAGWGGVALSLARQYPDHRVIGIELAPLPWLVAKLRAGLSGPKNLKIIHGDFLKHPLSDAGLVVCYLSANGLAHLKPKLASELAPGALVLSNTFAVPGWRPTDETAAGDIYHSPIYLYEMSADMEADARETVITPAEPDTASDLS